MDWTRLYFDSPPGPPSEPPGQTQGGGRKPPPEKPAKPASDGEETEGDE